MAAASLAWACSKAVSNSGRSSVEAVVAVAAGGVAVEKSKDDLDAKEAAFRGVVSHAEEDRISALKRKNVSDEESFIVTLVIGLGSAAFVVEDLSNEMQRRLLLSYVFVHKSDVSLELRFSSLLPLCHRTHFVRRGGDRRRQSSAQTS